MHYRPGSGWLAQLKEFGGSQKHNSCTLASLFARAESGRKIDIPISGYQSISRLSEYPDFYKQTLKMLFQNKCFKICAKNYRDIFWLFAILMR
jgi:hypothetical protein